jgi:hypothetical protein
VGNEFEPRLSISRNVAGNEKRRKECRREMIYRWREKEKGGGEMRGVREEEVERGQE